MILHPLQINDNAYGKIFTISCDYSLIYKLLLAQYNSFDQRSQKWIIPSKYYNRRSIKNVKVFQS